MLFFDLLFQSSACHLDDRFLTSTICIQVLHLIYWLKLNDSLQVICKLLRGWCQTRSLTSLKLYIWTESGEYVTSQWELQWKWSGLLAGGDAGRWVRLELTAILDRVTQGNFWAENIWVYSWYLKAANEKKHSRRCQSAREGPEMRHYGTMEEKRSQRPWSRLLKGALMKHGLQFYVTIVSK